mgnify:CR=1 FL=1
MATQARAKPGRQVVCVGSDRGSVQKLYEQIQPNLQKLLQETMRADRLLQIVNHTLLSTPRLVECSKASFVSAIVTCGKTGLVPGPRGLCWFIPRRTGPLDSMTGQKSWECHWQVGYKGVLELAYRSPRIARIQARAVREGDKFIYDFGEDYIIHQAKPNPEGEARPFTHAYARGWIRGVEKPNWEVMEAWEVQRRRDFGGYKPGGRSPWDGAFAEAMWLKTAAVKLCKYLPASEEMLSAVAIDERSTSGDRQEIEPEASEILDELGLEYEPPEEQGDDGTGEPQDGGDLIPRDEPPKEGA